MDKADFVSIRKALNKTQKQLSELLGVSIKAIHSYEQGWRSIPIYVERQLYFLLTRQNGRKKGDVPCWKRKNCGFEAVCPTYEYQSGDLCWFLSGTYCGGSPGTDGKEKMAICRDCEIILDLLANKKGPPL